MNLVSKKTYSKSDTYCTPNSMEHALEKEEAENILC